MSREISLPAETIAALLALPDEGDELFSLTDQREIIAWLDTRGLAWSWVDPQESEAARMRRLFGSA